MLVLFLTTISLALMAWMTRMDVEDMVFDALQTVARERRALQLDDEWFVC